MEYILSVENLFVKLALSIYLVIHSFSQYFKISIQKSHILRTVYLLTMPNIWLILNFLFPSINFFLILYPQIVRFKSYRTISPRFIFSIHSCINCRKHCTASFSASSFLVIIHAFHSYIPSENGISLIPDSFISSNTKSTVTDTPLFAFTILWHRLKPLVWNAISGWNPASLHFCIIIW